jgi:hypothetical protein
MLLHKGKSNENLNTFLLVDLVQVSLVQLYDLSHFASCMFWGFHIVASEQPGVVDCDPTSLVVSKECVALSGIEWSMVDYGTSSNPRRQQSFFIMLFFIAISTIHTLCAANPC